MNILEHRKNKRIFYHFKYILLIIILLITLFYYSEKNFDFINGFELQNNIKILIETDDKDKSHNIINTKLNYPRINILTTKDVTISNMNAKSHNVIYNTFEINDLKPYEEYNATLKFNIKGIKPGTLITYGTQIEEIDYISDDKTGLYENNVDLTDSKKFQIGQNGHLNLELNIKANSKGNAYVYIGITPKEQTELKYQISNIRMDKNAII